MGNLAPDAVELEGMRKEDSSWHPCQVSLSSDTRTGVGLLVEFESGEAEDVIFSKEDARARVRARSTPLEGDDCSRIKEGQHVLVSQETKFGTLFFDAEVDKVSRIRHSKRIHCRCTFVIKWFHPERRGGPMTVPASSIMKLAINNIDTHPVVGEFLNSVGSLSPPNVSPFASLFEDTLFETDLSRILEKQIEEIGKLADVTKKGYGEDILFEVKRVDLTGNANSGRISSQISLRHDQASPELNNSRRTTRRQSKIQTEMTGKDPPPTEPILEGHNRQHLSPLGARAALASLMYRLPPKEDLACTFRSPPEKDANAVLSDLANKHMDSDVHLQKTRASSRMQNRLKKTPNDKEDVGSSAVTLMTSLTTSVSDGKLTPPLKATRLTRSTIDKGIGHLDDKVNQKPSYAETKLRSPTCRLSNEQDDVGSSVATLKTSSACTVSGRNSNRLKKITSRLLHQKETEPSNDKVELKSPHEMKLTTTTNARRLTRSVIQKDTINVAGDVKRGYEESKAAKEVESPIENSITPETKGTRRKKSVPSPSDAEITESSNQERKKKLKVSNNISLTQESKGETSDTAIGLQGEKKKSISSKKQPEQQIFPRLKFLPRTRGQIKKQSAC